MKRILFLLLGIIICLSLVACKEISLKAKNKDATLPKIITVSESIEIEQGKQFEPLNYVTAIDDIDGDLTAKIVIKSNSVNIKKSGTYTVVYEVRDNANNSCQASIIVVVEEICMESKLKKGDLASVADVDLRTAVISWMWGKFNENWTNEYEVINSLSKPCRDVYACCTVVDEINNGGLNQLFFNYTVQFAQMAQEGFSSLGNEKLSSILKSAIEIYKENGELLEKYNDGTLESFSKSYNEKLFDELDNEFIKEESKFGKLLVTYIRNNESAFGD